VKWNRPTPDPERVIVGLLDTGYEFETAVADIVDNPIAANARKVRLLLAAVELPTDKVVTH
jgi:hypothetical protein